MISSYSHPQVTSDTSCPDLNEHKVSDKKVKLPVVFKFNYPDAHRTNCRYETEFCHSAFEYPTGRVKIPGV